MVAIRGQWFGLPNPTGVDGIWYQRTGDPPNIYVGLSKADLQALPKGGGSVAARTATWITNAQNALQNALGPGYVVTITVLADGTFTPDSVTIRDA